MQAVAEAKEELEKLKQKMERGKKNLSEKTRVRRIEEILRSKKSRRVIDYKLERKKHSFEYWEKEEAAKLEEALEGVYILRTKDEKLTAIQVLEAYKDLMYVERSFRTMKSVLELRPFWHRIEDRIRAHALICYLALLIDRYVQRAVKASAIGLSSHHAFESLKQLGAAMMEIDGQRYTYTSKPTGRHLSLFKALGLKAPRRCWVESP